MPTEATVPEIVPASRRATSWRSPGLTMWYRGLLQLPNHGEAQHLAGFVAEPQHPDQDRNLMMR
jgi:hypothetical protein